MPARSSGCLFPWKGTAFFVEAIALGLFLYGWDRIPKWIHWGTGVVVGISGLISGILVVAANAWMNAPAGFDYVDSQYLNADPIAAMFNDAWFTQALHMSLAAFVATGFAVAGLHAFLLLRGKRPEFHRKAFMIAMVFAAIAAILQPISGDLSAKDVAVRQPAKLAAFEAHFHTEEEASLVIGGWPDVENRTVKYAVKIPKALSFLAHGNFSQEVTGLDQIDEELWPPVVPTHLAFQLMVGIGTLLAGLGVFFLLGRFKWKHWLEKKRVLQLFALAAPLGFIAVEAGWVVTEVGRQPWIINGIMKTSEALTPMPGIQYSFYFFTFVYLVLTAVVTLLMIRQIRVLHNPELKITLKKRDRKPPNVSVTNP